LTKSTVLKKGEKNIMRNSIKDPIKPVSKNVIDLTKPLAAQQQAISTDPKLRPATGRSPIRNSKA